MIFSPGLCENISGLPYFGTMQGCQLIEQNSGGKS